MTTEPQDEPPACPTCGEYIRDPRDHDDDCDRSHMGPVELDEVLDSWAREQRYDAWAERQYDRHA